MLYVVNDIFELQGINWSSLDVKWLIYDGGYHLQDELDKYCYGLPVYTLPVRTMDGDETLHIVENSVGWCGLEDFFGLRTVKDLVVVGVKDDEYLYREGARDFAFICVRDVVFCGDTHTDVAVVLEAMGYTDEPIVCGSYHYANKLHMDNTGEEFRLYLQSGADYIIIDTGASNWQHSTAVDVLESKYPDTKIFYNV